MHALSVVHQNALSALNVHAVQVQGRSVHSISQFVHSISQSAHRARQIAQSAQQSHSTSQSVPSTSQSAHHVLLIAQSAQRVLSISQHAHLIRQSAQRVLSTSQSAHHVLLIAQNVQRAISQSLLVIVAQRLVVTMSHNHFLRVVAAMLQKISVQMIHISHQIWQMPISLMQHRSMQLLRHSAS
jgi:hypothetical protein